MKLSLAVFAACLVVLSACATTPQAQPTTKSDVAAPAPTPGTNAATPNAIAVGLIEAAKSSIQQGQLEDAITKAQEAVKSDPNASETHYILGNAYSEAARIEADSAKQSDFFSKAIDAYSKAIGVNSNNASARHNLSMVYYQRGQFADARSQIEAALKIEPNDPKTRYALGSILLADPSTGAEGLTRAQAEFETATKLDPNMPEAHTGLAAVYLSKNDPARALVFAKKGVELSGANVDPFTLWQLAQAECGTGDKTNGTQTLQKILAANVSNPAFVQQAQLLAQKCK
jgi:tetratricopeptide (TPR) repeat protein